MLPEEKKKKGFTSGLSAPGEGPDSPYTVLDSFTKKPITGCFVLRPQRDYMGFYALQKYFKILKRWSSTKEGLEDKVAYLEEWLSRLESLWGMHEPK